MPDIYHEGLQYLKNTGNYIKNEYLQRSKVKNSIIIVEKYIMKDNGFKASNANIPKGITKLLPWLELF